MLELSEICQLMPNSFKTESISRPFLGTDEIFKEIPVGKSILFAIFIKDSSTVQKHETPLVKIGQSSGYNQLRHTLNVYYHFKNPRPRFLTCEILKDFGPPPLIIFWKILGESKKEDSVYQKIRLEYGQGILEDMGYYSKNKLLNKSEN